MPFPPLSPRTGLEPARIGSPKRASFPARTGPLRRVRCLPEAARYVHPRLRCARGRLSSGTWTVACRTSHRRLLELRRQIDHFEAKRVFCLEDYFRVHEIRPESAAGHKCERELATSQSRTLGQRAEPARSIPTAVR